MEFNKIKACTVCGCLAIIIITASGPICKKCFKELYRNPDMPAFSFLENLEPRSGIIYNVSRSAVADTATTGTIDFDNL